MLPSLSVKTARLWRGILPFTPRPEGAYDTHHRTARIAGRTQRRGGLAAHGACAAAADAGDRIHERALAGGFRAPRRGVPSRPEGGRLRRGPERCDRVPLGAR